jgi:hypothetical protein
MSDTPTATESAAIPDDEMHCVYVLEGKRQSRLWPRGWFRPGNLLSIVAITVVIVLITLTTKEHRHLDLRNAVILAAVVSSLWILSYVVVAYILAVLRSAKGTEVRIGADFLATCGMPLGYTPVAKFDDVTRVTLDLSKGRITGGIVSTRRGPIALTRIQTPALAIRAILDHAPQTVKWRRSWPPFSSLGRDEVERLVEQADVPGLDSLLPPGRRYMHYEEMCPANLPKGELYTTRFMGIQTPSPAGRYANILLLQMFRDGSTTRTLKRSEPLTDLTLDDETVAAPPLDDLLAELKKRCGLPPKPSRRPVEGTIEMTIDTSPCTLHGRFDDRAEVCCTLHLERGQEERQRP